MKVMIEHEVQQRQLKAALKVADELQLVSYDQEVKQRLNVAVMNERLKMEILLLHDPHSVRALDNETIFKRLLAEYQQIETGPPLKKFLPSSVSSKDELFQRLKDNTFLITPGDIRKFQELSAQVNNDKDYGKMTLKLRHKRR